MPTGDVRPSDDARPMDDVFYPTADVYGDGSAGIRAEIDDRAQDGRAPEDRADTATADTDRAAESTARILCLRQLDARSRTRVELARYLHRKGIPPGPAHRVLDRFTEAGLIDDHALAESYVVSRHQEQGLARGVLTLKLRQRGVEDSVIESAVALVDSDSELAAARSLIERRRRSVAGLPPPVQTRRLVALLARKGYPSGLAYQVVRQALECSGGAGPATSAIDDAISVDGPA